jgi:aminopeptidase N
MCFFVRASSLRLKKEDIESIFGAIVYAKGACVIRMIADYIGQVS